MKDSRKSSDKPPLGSDEGQAWDKLDRGWRPLFGRFHSLGFSFEWHEFRCDQEINWAQSFHPQSVEICLNLAGNGVISAGGSSLELKPETYGFYSVGSGGPDAGVGEGIRAQRLAGEGHRFLTVELSHGFLRDQVQHLSADLHPIVRAITETSHSSAAVSAPERLTSRHQKLLDNLKAPPVFAAAQELWYRSKALEVISEFLFQSQENDQTLFCVRQQKIAQERVAKVKDILESRMSEPPNLEELGKMVGCSHYYLSRTFSREMGMTISQYLRRIRIDKAAELLETGKFNVTEVAMEVGYSSLSHFSHAFQQQTGCCPGLYPLKKLK